MQIKISTKGQVVLPIAARKKFQLKAGDSLDFQMDTDGMRLIPKKQKKRKGRIVIDRKTGMAAVTLGPGAPVITSEWVAKMLEDFP